MLAEANREIRLALNTANAQVFRFASAGAVGTKEIAP